MKRILLIVWLGLAGFAINLRGQGTVFFNNYDSGFGVYYSLDPMGGPMGPAPAGTFVQILGGTSVTHLFPLLTSTGSGPVFILTAAGVEARGPGSGSFFDAGSGAVPGVTPSGVAFFEVQVWWGAPSFTQTIFRNFPVIWNQQTGSAENPAPLRIVFPIVMYLPEPSAPALLGIGAVVIGWHRLRRRRHGAVVTTMPRD